MLFCSNFICILPIFKHGHTGYKENESQNCQRPGAEHHGDAAKDPHYSHNKGNATITIATEPYDGAIDASKPDGAVSLKQVIQKLESQSRSGRLGASTEDNTTLDNKTWQQKLESLLAPDKTTNAQ